MTVPTPAVPASPREAALAAIEGLLKKASPGGTVRRNEALPEAVDPFGHIVLLDGGGSAEALVGSVPTIWSWTWQAEVVVAAQSQDPEVRSGRLHALMDSVSAVLLAHPRPTAEVHAAIVSAELDQSFQPANGVVPISVATLGILLEYSTVNPTG